MSKARAVYPRPAVSFVAAYTHYSSYRYFQARVRTVSLVHLCQETAVICDLTLSFSERIDLRRVMRD